jgi:hypothetical protein
MDGNVFIPKKLKVGFQERSDTYTKKLAYVIYFDEKGALRKEASWESWRDKKIDPIEYDNIPTCGFVLNKKVGGYKSGWDFRDAYVRVFDPRGFEFEITVPNLLFILENTSAIKGKGLEGDFVYGWRGPELVLIPTECPSYIELKKINDLRHNREHITSKELILGATYRSKSNVTLIYLGKFNFYKRNVYLSHKAVVSQGLYYYFRNVENKFILTMKSLGDSIVELIDGTCVGNYAELIEALDDELEYNPIDPTKTKRVPYTLEELKQIDFLNLKWSWNAHTDQVTNGAEYSIYVSLDKSSVNKKYMCHISYKDRYSFDTIDEIYNKYKPYRIDYYLLNGKKCKSD